MGGQMPGKAEKGAWLSNTGLRLGLVPGSCAAFCLNLPWCFSKSFQEEPLVPASPAGFFHMEILALSGAAPTGGTGPGNLHCKEIASTTTTSRGMCAV